MSFSVAIDGPAGAGKSTIAKQIAKDLGFIYVDTGAMYRALAVHFLRQGIKAEELYKIKEAIAQVEVTIAYEDGVQQVFLNGENVTPFLRTEEVGNMASASSVYPEVRLKLVELQRKLAETADVIMDGREIGTFVLPGADVKVYLTASSACRAKRRYAQLQEKGALGDKTLESIQADIEERDYRDMNRDFAPLRQAEDAVLVDSSDMTVEQVIETISALIRR
ncbi:MAG: (d)CMP kinase [Lachnospiraceae bacterium]|nr:(d)CMP kinase [Lachnospiraceae bacterium]